MKKKAKCPKCEGTGEVYKDSTMSERNCPNCKGTGFLKILECSRCNGTGKLYDDWTYSEKAYKELQKIADEDMETAFDKALNDLSDTKFKECQAFAKKYGLRNLTRTKDEHLGIPPQDEIDDTLASISPKFRHKKVVKVYCNDCQHFAKKNKFFVGPFPITVNAKCDAKENVKTVDAYNKQYEVYIKTPEKINKNNNCKYYIIKSKQKWFSKLLKFLS